MSETLGATALLAVGLGNANVCPMLPTVSVVDVRRALPAVFKPPPVTQVGVTSSLTMLL